MDEYSLLRKQDGANEPIARLAVRTQSLVCPSIKEGLKVIFAIGFLLAIMAASGVLDIWIWVPRSFP